MAIDSNVSTDARDSRVRFWVYWLSAVAATIIFLFFMTTMVMVPGVSTSAKMWMLSLTGIVVAIPLTVGMWRFGSTEAPAMAWPLGPIAGVVLLLEFAECVISIIHLAIKAIP